MRTTARIGIWILRILCGGYWVVTTALLLTPDPLRWMRLLQVDRVPLEGHSPLVHLAVFAVLTLITFGSRLPVPNIATLAALVGYAAATEYLQRLVPPRSVELIDFAGNLLGILVGACLYAAGHQWWRRRKESKYSDRQPNRLIDPQYFMKPKD